MAESLTYCLAKAGPSRARIRFDKCLSCLRFPVSGFRSPVSGVRFSLTASTTCSSHVLRHDHCPQACHWKSAYILLPTNQRYNMFGTVHLFVFLSPPGLTVWSLISCSICLLSCLCTFDRCLMYGVKFPSLENLRYVKKNGPFALTFARQAVRWGLFI